ncbi:hypothetical protein GPECTOR_7g1291 [Gonium pectorale]|uniref:Uncharacterized protein n=1 Tax=Gonium pectorale TaxID=33097 RepID=A0A150GU60_GONPE|nr:hypothetical protein GPECTOR_7g1291 [Gonium pectorale]|eukprot:KXZ53395.1 hypothetical protein GPECTOR_7g1291 [Gonium pectorale]
MSLERAASTGSTDGGPCGATAKPHFVTPVGQHIASLVDAAITRPDDVMADVGAGAGAPASFCIAWPPTFTAGGPAESVELRAALTAGACACAAAPVATGAASGGGRCGMAAAVSSLCGRLLCVSDDVVVAEERMSVDGAGCASARVRMVADSPRVATCLLADKQGLPVLESLADSAPLLALPPPAREEAHRLLWRMMHEALPPAHSELPFDPEAFASPLASLPAKLQAALCWAWTHHFRAFVRDWAFVLDYHPPPPATEPPPATASSEPESEPDASADYGSVMVQMASFLRDNRMFACLATLLQSAVERGMRIEPDGSCSFGPQQPGAEAAEAEAEEAAEVEWLPPAPPSPAASALTAAADGYESDACAAPMALLPVPPPLRVLAFGADEGEGRVDVGATAMTNGASASAAPFLPAPPSLPRQQTRGGSTTAALLLLLLLLLALALSALCTALPSALPSREEAAAATALLQALKCVASVALPFALSAAARRNAACAHASGGAAGLTERLAGAVQAGAAAWHATAAASAAGTGAAGAQQALKYAVAAAAAMTLLTAASSAVDGA